MSKIKTGKLWRMGEILTREAGEGEDDRRVDLAFSSEAPYERFFGIEVLDHNPKSVRMDFLGGGSAPLLLDHDPEKQIGVIERASIDGDRRGRATVRFGKSALAEEVLNDVRDGIRSNVSVGYFIKDMVEEETEGGSQYRATDWSPLEVSIVSIPADQTVGVGRSDDGEFEIEVQDLTRENSIKQEIEMEVKDQDVAAVDVKAIEAQALARVNEIAALGREHGFDKVATDFIREGKSIEDMRAYVVEHLDQSIKVAASKAEDPEIGLTDKEAKDFSFLRALNALANPRDRHAQEAAAFEIEASRAAEAKTGRSAQGIMVPHDIIKREVFQRDLNVGTATAGGNVVATDLLAASFIELLRNRSALSASGMTTLSGLNGDIAIPKQTGGATAYWISTEGGAPTESQQTIGQVPMTPKTLGAFTDFTRQLMLQSSIDVENFVRMDLVRVLALAIDLAGLEGDGTGGAPTGIKSQTGINTTTFGAANPTYSELVAMETAVAVDNADIGSMAYILNAAMRGHAKSTEKFTGSNGATIWEPGNTLNGYPAIVSNQVTTGDVHFGNFGDLMLGLWGGLDLTVDPYTHSTSGTVRVVALQSCDFAVRNPVSFCVSNDGV